MREGLLERVWCGNQSYPWLTEFDAQPPAFELFARDSNLDLINFGVPQFADITMPQVPAGETCNLNLMAVLPPVATPWGNIILPEITAAAIDDSGTFKITIDNPVPVKYKFKGELELRALFANGTYVDVKTFAGDSNGVFDIAQTDFKSANGEAVALGSVRWQLVRVITTKELSGSGHLTGKEPLEYAGNTIRIAAKPDMAATLTRTGICFVRENRVAGQLNLLDELGTPSSLPYLYGNKIQPIAFTQDLSRAYVGGTGAVYEIADGEQWMAMIQSRNVSSHAYDERTAEQLVNVIIKQYFPLFVALQTEMEKYLP
jgi:hypothetical protein